MALLRRIWGGRGRHAPPTPVEAFRRADGYRRLGRYAEALELVTYGLSVEPGSVTGHLLAGYLHQTAHALEDAKREFGWVLARDANHARALLGLARIAFEEGDAARGRDLLRRALRFYPDFPEATALLEGMTALHAPEPAAVREGARLDRLRMPSVGRALLVARADGSVLAARPGGPQDVETSARLAQTLRLAGATLARSGVGALRRAIVEDDGDALFMRTDGDVIVSVTLPRTLDVTQGLLEVNRLWAGALHELGLAAGPPTAAATPPVAADDTNRRAS